MKIIKKLVSLLCVLTLFASLLTVSAFAKNEANGTASETVKFTVVTGSRWGSNYVKLKQTKGTAPYKTLATLILEGEDANKEAKLYGKYSVNVYDSNGERNEDYSCIWDVAGLNNGETKKIKLGDDSTYTVEVVPWKVEDVFCAYIEHSILHWRGMKYLSECLHYDGAWSSTPEWSVSSKAGVKSISQ